MEPDKKTNGAMVGLVIIIIILIIGGIYIWQTRELPATQSEVVTEENLQELESLEQDIESTDTSVGVEAEAVN